MRVAFLSLFRRGHGGGEGRVAHELARHFAEHHDTVMVCPSDETGLFQEEDSQLRVFGVRSAGDGEFQMPALSAKTVRATFDFLDAFSPQVVHAHEPALVGLVGQIWAKMNRVPFVHTSHVLPGKALDFGAADALDMKLLQGSLSESISRRVLMDFYKNCDAIVALNQSALAALRGFGYEGKIFVIPNGRDLDRYADCGTANVEAEEKMLTFIGYLSERKNQAYLINALDRLPESYKLVLLGKALNPEYREHLERMCRDRDLESVVFAGQVPHQEIPSYLERSHVFVSASKMEVQSLVVIEALASGTPVVGLSNETIDELVDDQVGAHLPKEARPRRFAESVRRICDLSAPDYEALCQNAQARVSHLDWSNVVEQTTEAYQDLMDEKASISQEEGAVLADLVSTLPPGDVRRLLRERIAIARREPGPVARSLMKLSLGERWRALKRVPGSTWLLAAATVVVSLIGYLFMRGRDETAD